MAAGAHPVTFPQLTQAETEQRIVVDGVDLDGARELRPRGVEPTGAEVRPGEGLADRPLVGLELTRPLEGDDRRMHVRAGEQPAAFLECVVGSGCHVLSFGRRFRAVCDNRISSTKANRPVPEFLPFRGIRYAPEAAGPADGPTDVGPVAAPPYDVIDDDLRAVLEASHPRNAVRLILPRDGERGRDRYEVAADCLDEWRRAGTLVLDDEPRFYLYEMLFEDEDGRYRRTHGAVGALGLPPPGADPSVGGVLPHERTMTTAKSDRLSLLRATRANLDPIWVLSLTEGLSALLVPHQVPLIAYCEDQEGVTHRLFPLTDAARVEAVSEAMAAAPVVLADGHHRFETACAYRDERVQAGLDDPGAERIMAFAAELADDELCVRPIHRLLHGLHGTDARRALTGAFTVVEAGPNTPEGIVQLRARMRDDGALGLVDRSGLALLRPTLDVTDFDEILRDVDSVRFDTHVRPALPGATATFRSDAAAVAALVEKGAADAAVLLRPVTVAQIRAAAFAGVRMPEKTTFFSPKPRTGMVFRSLDEQGVAPT
jgi:uncharacterized protein (DUF1015 family)